MTLRVHTFAGWAEGADVLANSGTGSGDQLTRVIRASGADINALAAAAMSGASKGGRCLGPSAVASSLGWLPLTVFNNIAVSVDLKFESIPSVDHQRLLQTFRGDGSSSSLRVTSLASGALQFVNAANAILVVTAVQTLAAWQAGFKMQIYGVKGTTTADGVLQCKITRLSDNVVIMDTGILAGNAGTVGFQGAEAGRCATAVAWTGYTDVSGLALEDAAVGLISTASNNQAPTCTIAAEQLTDFEPGDTQTITLTENDDFGVTTRTFRQVSGPAATISGSGLTRTITAPYTLTGGNMVFGYKVGDAQGAESGEATVSIELLPADWRIGTGGSAKPLKFRIGPA